MSFGVGGVSDGLASLAEIEAAAQQAVLWHPLNDGIKQEIGIKDRKEAGRGDAEPSRLETSPSCGAAGSSHRGKSAPVEAANPIPTASSHGQRQPWKRVCTK